jgi:hypothetical protein
MNSFMLAMLLKEKKQSSWLKKLFEKKNNDTWLSTLVEKKEISTEQSAFLKDLLEKREKEESVVEKKHDSTNQWWKNLFDQKYNGHKPFWAEHKLSTSQTHTSHKTTTVKHTTSHKHTSTTHKHHKTNWIVKEKKSESEEPVATQVIPGSIKMLDDMPILDAKAPPAPRGMKGGLRGFSNDSSSSDSGSDSESGSDDMFI